MSPVSSLNVLALEPWLGGSHRAFLESWRARSAHALEILGLAPRSWKWRMSAGAWELAREISTRAGRAPDALVVSDYVDLPGLLGFLPASYRSVPTLLYFHENQLTYPARPHPSGTESAQERDHHHGFTNILSCLRADTVVFNTRYHLDAFAAAADALLARLPKPNPRADLAKRLGRAQVVPVGIELEGIPLGPGAPQGRPLRVAFNHRWEHDKDPATFLRAAREALRRGARLELALFGERYGDLPPGVPELLDELEEVTLQTGFVADRKAYVEALGSCDVVASSARHEFYGVSVLEGLAAGCRPLLPARLSYPELLPRALHPEALYDEDQVMVERLVQAAATPAPARDPDRRAAWRAVVTPHAAARTAEELDRLCAEPVREA